MKSGEYLQIVLILNTLANGVIRYNGYDFIVL